MSNPPEKRDPPSQKNDAPDSPEIALRKAELEFRLSQNLADLQKKSSDQLKALEDQKAAVRTEINAKIAPLEDAKLFGDGKMREDIKNANNELVKAQRALTDAEDNLRMAKAKVEDLKRRKAAADKINAGSNPSDDIAHLQAEKDARLDILDKKVAVVNSRMAVEEEAAKAEHAKGLKSLEPKMNQEK